VTGGIPLFATSHHGNRYKNSRKKTNQTRTLSDKCIAGVCVCVWTSILFYFFIFFLPWENGNTAVLLQWLRFASVCICVVYWISLPPPLSPFSIWRVCSVSFHTGYNTDAERNEERFAAAAERLANADGCASIYSLVATNCFLLSNPPMPALYGI
jgi:hypothetical protein